MIADRIRQARLAAGLTLGALGEQVGVSHTAIQKYEKGLLTPSSTQLLKLARACGIRTEYFFRTHTVELLQPEFRKLSTFGKTAQDALKIKVVELVEKRVELLGAFPELPFPAFAPPANLPEHITSLDEIDAFSDSVRNAWQLGLNPIADLTDTLEGLGLLVIVVDEENPGFSGLTAKARTDDGREYPVVKNINEDAGKGVSGEVNGHAVRVGRLSFAAAGEDGFLAVGEAVPSRSEDDLRTRFGLLQPDEMASYVSVDGQLIARIVLRDVPRANAKAALAKLHELGVTELAMLTGDKRASANIIASEVGIDEVHAELFPEDKVAAVRAATGAGKTVTMMVGDGVNDAPVLAVADIGVAMTDGTSTAASESAQVVIMNDNIAAVPRAIAIARRTKRVMLQAVIAGLVLATIGMIAAAFNLIPVVVGAFLQEAIDVVSILWALTALIDRD